jgi:hypothetical protein
MDRYRYIFIIKELNDHCPGKWLENSKVLILGDMFHLIISNTKKEVSECVYAIRRKHGQNQGEAGIAEVEPKHSNVRVST